jgi:hypothetical protein
MAEEQQRKAGWREKQRAKKQRKRERTGDSPEKQAERKQPPRGADDDVAGAMWHTGTAGYLSGGF